MLSKAHITRNLMKADTLTEETIGLLNRAYDMTTEELISIAKGTHKDIADDRWFEPLPDFCARHGIKSKVLKEYEHIY